MDSQHEIETSIDNKNDQNQKKFRIDIFRGWCKSCGICVALCPRKCLETRDDGSPVVIAEEKCTGCGWCETHCPDFAISVRKIKALQKEDM